MKEDVKARCARIFGASKKIESLYVAGEKIFENLGAALSYSTKVEEVTRGEFCGEKGDEKSGEKAGEKAGEGKNKEPKEKEE